MATGKNYGVSQCRVVKLFIANHAMKLEGSLCHGAIQSSFRKTSLDASVFKAPVRQYMVVSVDEMVTKRGESLENLVHLLDRLLKR